MLECGIGSNDDSVYSYAHCASTLLMVYNARLGNGQLYRPTSADYIAIHVALQKIMCRALRIPGKHVQDLINIC